MEGNKKIDIFKAMVELERAKNFDHGLAGVDDILQEQSRWYLPYKYIQYDRLELK